MNKIIFNNKIRKSTSLGTPDYVPLIIWCILVGLIILRTVTR